jgi:gliding motility-associatede transport system auxiliary component
MALKESITGRGGRRVLEGTNFVIYTVVVVAIIVAANFYVNRYFSRRWDLTPNKKFSLSPETAKLLRGLKQDVTIYDFDRQGGSQSHRDLLDNYGAESPRVSVRYVDPDREPALARQYDVRSYGTVVVASGDRQFQAQTADEEGVTNALIRLLKGQKTAYFVQGHGERDLESAERAGLSQLKKEFENENYQVKTLVLLQKMEIPSDCSLLVIAGPRHEYLPQEVDTISKYVEGGGRLMLLLDPGVDLPNLAKLLANWNVTVRNDLVIDENPLARLAGAEPSMPLIIKYGSSPIVQPLARTATLFPLTRSFLIGKDQKTGVVDDSLCETTDASFGVADFNPKMQTVSFRPDKDYKGPLTVAVSGTVDLQGATEPGGKKKPEGRFVAMGTSSLAVNAYLGFGGNRDLVMNAVNWLAAEEDLISIRPKPPENQHLDLNEQQMRRFLFLGVLGVPLLIIVLGISVWWGRR